MERLRADEPDRLALRDAILLGFLATGIVASKLALRWHLHITGHAMLPIAMLLVLARLTVSRSGAASLVGLLAGLAAAGLGLGRGGPLIVLRTLLPGLVVDATGRLGHGRLLDRRFAALTGALAGIAQGVPGAAFELVAGLSPEVVLVHAGSASLAKAAFGAIGGFAAAVIGQRLHHHGLLPGVRVVSRHASSGAGVDRAAECEHRAGVSGLDVVHTGSTISVGAPRRRPCRNDESPS